jgi:hypothetical protein
VRNQAGIGSAQAVRHLERVEHELGVHVRRELPTDDHPAVAVEDEGEVDEAVPGADVGHVGDPLLVRTVRAEVALQEVAGPLGRGLVGGRRAVLAAAELALEPVLAHHASNPVTADLDVSAAELLPGLAGAVDLPAAAAGSLDLHQQLTVGKLTRRGLPGSARVVRAHRHAQCSADRLDPEGIPPLHDVAGHRRRVGSSS